MTWLLRAVALPLIAIGAIGALAAVGLGLLLAKAVDR